jgi:excisionase family DNA binding protein
MQNATNPKLLSRAEAAERLGVSKAALEAWAHRGKPALPYIKCGGAARYRESDIENFMASRTATSAAQHAAATA